MSGLSHNKSEILDFVLECEVIRQKSSGGAKILNLYEKGLTKEDVHVIMYLSNF